jgi:5-methylcytosine-specific restriction endonuclease McrA
MLDTRRKIAMLNDDPDEFAIPDWSDSTLQLAIRAGFRCDYCGSDFFASVENYYAFEVEHIVPRGRGSELDEAPENLTVACRTCNRLKRRWDIHERWSERVPRVLNS